MPTFETTTADQLARLPRPLAVYRVKGACGCPLERNGAVGARSSRRNPNVGLRRAILLLVWNSHLGAQRTLRQWARATSQRIHDCEVEQEALTRKSIPCSPEPVAGI